MTHYLLSVHHSESDVPPAATEWPQIFADVAEFNEKLGEAGNLLYVGNLMPVEQGWTVSPTGERSEESRVSGPLVLSGVWVINVDGIDAALSWAAKAAAASRQVVEVRPFQPKG